MQKSYYPRRFPRGASSAGFAAALDGLLPVQQRHLAAAAGVVVVAAVACGVVDAPAAGVVVDAPAACGGVVAPAAVVVTA